MTEQPPETDNATYLMDWLDKWVSAPVNDVRRMDMKELLRRTAKNEHG